MTDNSNFFSSNLSTEEKKRLDRQLRLPGWNQNLLKESNVVIVGIGGLGTEIAKNLAMVGVGTLHLIDMDTIEFSNLNRQILFSDGDEGEPKAKVAAKTLEKINPHCNYIWHFGKLETINPEIYQNADLIIAGLDSVNARKELTRRAVHSGVPMIDGGTMTYYGHVYTYLPQKNACLECDPTHERERETLAACTLVGIPRKRIHCLLKGQLYFESKFNRPPEVSNQEEIKVVLEYANNLIMQHFPQSETFSFDEAVNTIDSHEPTIITINAVIASLQSQEAVKILHHRKGVQLGVINHEYNIYNGLSGKFFYLEKPPNPKCMLCGPMAPKLLKFVLPATTTFDALLRLLKTRNVDFSEEEQPSIYRIDTEEIEPVEVTNTFQDEGIKNYETLYITGDNNNGESIEFYLKVKYKTAGETK
jgi:molybdopterin/thiamine biosynthesis adenylyltransferase